MPAPQSYPTNLVDAATRATAEASRHWERAASTPGRSQRIVTSARIAWDAAYPLAFAHGYLALAVRAATAFDSLRGRLELTDVQQAELRRLVDLAGRATARPQEPPPVPRRVVEAAVTAVMDRRDGSSAPEAITRAVHREAVVEGGTHGALSAAEQIRSGWRMWTSRAVLGTKAGETTLKQLVDTTLAAANRDFVTEWAASAGRHCPVPLAVARASFGLPVTEAPRPAAGVRAASVVIPLQRRSRS